MSWCQPRVADASCGSIGFRLVLIQRAFADLPPEGPRYSFPFGVGLPAGEGMDKHLGDKLEPRLERPLPASLFAHGREGQQVE
jgi:hypothetical protein